MPCSRFIRLAFICYKLSILQESNEVVFVDSVSESGSVRHLAAADGSYKIDTLLHSELEQC